MIGAKAGEGHVARGRRLAAGRPGVAILLALLALAAPASAMTSNAPTPYFKCMGWLDRDDVNAFRQCFYREMEAVVGAAARAHNAVITTENRLRALPRDAGNPALFAAESCARSRDIAGAIIQGIREAGAARQTIDEAGGTLRIMHGQIVQHASFRMRHRQDVRAEVERVGAANLAKIDGGLRRVVGAEEGFRAMRVADRCRQPEPTLPSGEYEDNVNYVAGNLRPGFYTESVQACHWYCTNNSQCRALTYVREARTCWLKSTVGTRYRDTCCVSKVVR